MVSRVNHLIHIMRRGFGKTFPCPAASCGIDTAQVNMTLREFRQLDGSSVS